MQSYIVVYKICNLMCQTWIISVISGFILYFTYKFQEQKVEMGHTHMHVHTCLYVWHKEPQKALPSLCSTCRWSTTQVSGSM